MASSCKVSGNCSKFLIGYITITGNSAKKLARDLVTNNYAACVNIFPVTSVYKWKNKLEEDEECLLMVKTRQEKINSLMEFVKKNHPYETPEIIFNNITAGNPDYLKWIEDSVPISDGE